MNKLFAIARATGFGRFLIAAGLMLLVFGLAALILPGDTSGFVETVAVVSRVEPDQPAYRDSEGEHEATDAIYIRYSAEGEEYEVYFGSFAGFRVGDTVTIRYNPDAPQQFTQPGNTVISLAMIAGGAAALAGGSVSLVRAVKKSRKMKQQEEEWKHG